MKQMGFLDNVRTPEDWQRRALKAAEADGLKPKLKKWQSAGIVAVTAAAVIGMAVMPMFYGMKENNAPVESTAQEVYDRPAEVKEVKDVKVKDKYTDISEDNEGVRKMNGMYGHTESVTVLECVRSEDTDDILLVGARRSYQTGNFLFCTTLPTDGDALSGSTELPKFGDQLVLGFDTLYGEDWLDADYTMVLDERDYVAVQNKGTLYCKGYAVVGKSDDEFFNGILSSSQAAAGATEYSIDDRVRKFVIGSYCNITHIKPKIKGGIKRSGEDTGLETHMMTTIFDEDFISGGVVSQLYLMRIEKTDGGKLSAVSTFDSLEKTCSLEIDGRKGSLKTKCDTDIDILNVRVVEDAVNENTAYLLINAVDKERTGDIRGNLKIDIVLDEVKEQEKVAPHEPVCIKTQHTEVEDGAYDFSVVPSEDVEVWHSTADGLKGTQFVYTFELTGDIYADKGDINTEYDVQYPNRLRFTAGGKIYIADAPEGYDISLHKFGSSADGKITLKIMLAQDELTNEPKDDMIISFSTDDGSAGCKVVFTNEKTETYKGIRMTGLERY